MVDSQAKSDFYFRTAQEKAHFVRRMFDAIARRYDLMNRLMTFGQDQSWRRLAIRRAMVPRGGRVLDIAAGTADLAVAALAARPQKVVAADFSWRMLEMAERKLQGQNVNSQVVLTAADGLCLPFVSGYFDAVVTAFSLRNVADLDLFLREMLRVTRPGGRVVSLEIVQPYRPGLQPLFSWYFGRLVPTLGRWISGDAQAYAYLPHSVAIFLSPEELRERMLAAGMDQVGFERLQLGTIAIHWGARPAK